ncbi:MAG: tetratricopeptide repeat protein [Xanthomonadales bacterium]|nr:tetratricopeptide repeat protein [Xanthomonadales bacterium]
MKTWIALFFATSLAGCVSTAPVNAPNPVPDSVPPRVAERADTDWPATPQTLATTSGDIYLDNLNGQIETISTNPRFARHARFQVTLGSLLYQRFQIEGRIEDAERARRVLLEAEELPGFTSSDHLVLAKVLKGFHDFDNAARHIDVAAEGGAEPVQVAAARRSLQRALSLPGLQSLDPDPLPNDYVAAVEHAAALLNQGRLAAASESLRHAQVLYTDVNPLPLAWIHLQQGIAYLRHGDIEDARRFFEAAHQRFPQYFLATEHLAETELLLGNAHRAAALYRIVTAQNNQPAFWHGLAQAEAALGNQAAASIAAERAASGYEQLLAAHPLMFADHAVGYYLDMGDVSRALELARLNYEHRQDLMARLALAEALHEAGRHEAACSQVKSLTDAGLAPPEVTLPGETLSACR